MNIEESIEILESYKESLEEYEDNPRIIQAIETLLTAYEKEKEENKKAIDFINDENNYFEDGENWQNLLKIKQILEE